MVSVITPAYNAEKFIEQCILSVKQQTYSNWELVVVDDASTDNTAALIKQMAAADQRIQFIKHQYTQGAGSARSTALKQAKGQFIAFLDADDLWHPDKLKTQVAYMQKHKVNVCFSSYELIDEQGQSLHTLIEALPVLTYKKQLKCNYIGNLTGIYNAEVLGKIPISTIKKRQDWLMWLQALKISGKAFGISKALAYYRVRNNSVSSNKFKLVKFNFQIYRKELKFNLLKSLWYMCLFFYEYFVLKPRQQKHQQFN